MPSLFPVSLLLNGVVFTVLFYSIWRFMVPQTYLGVLKTKSFSVVGLLLILAYMVINKSMVYYNNNPFMNELRVFLGNYWTYLNLKPLIGLVDTIQFFGIVVCLLLVLWKPLVQSAIKDGPKILFLLFATLFLIQLPEARHTLCLLPYFLFLLFTRFDFSHVPNRYFWVSAISALLISRYYYPLSWAEFPPNHKLFVPETNPVIYQEFPAQHFFMHSGITISHANYAIFFVLALVLMYFAFGFGKHIVLRKTINRVGM